MVVGIAVAVMFLALALVCLAGWRATRNKLAELQKSQQTLEGSTHLLAEERLVLELISQGATKEEVLAALTKAIERVVPDTICSVLLLDIERNCLVCGAAPNLPPGYWEMCNELPLVKDLGSCPAAAFADETMIAENIATDFRWAAVKDLALKYGLQSCWSVPIRSSQNKELLGTFAMYRRYPWKPTAVEIEAVQAGAHLAGNAIERLRVQQSLRDYKERFELAEKGAAIGIWQWDPKDEMFTLSAGAAAISGFPPEPCRLTFPQLHATIHPDDSLKLSAGRERLYRSGEPYEIEYRRIFPDGTTRWLRNRSSAQFENGVVKQIVGAVIEITEQKELQIRLEKAIHSLRDYKERFEVAEKAASFGIWQFDPNDGIFTLSAGAAAVSGFSDHPCRVTAEQLNATIHPEDLPRLKAERHRFFQQGGVYEVEYRRVFPDGTVRWLRNRSNAEFEEGVPKQVVGAVLEITQQKELQLRLEKAKAEAEDAVRTKSQFLANMSHEIRTPMNAVMGMTSLLLDLDLNEAARDYVNTIRTSSDSLLSIINDILDFSKIESGKLDLESIPVSLHECLEEAAELLSPKASDKQLDLAVHIESSLADWIYGDATRLRQIVVNLVGNAVKFTEKGAVILRAQKESRADNDISLHLSVQDTGIGIPADKVDRLFQSFTQVDASTTRKFGGTGLGLAISKRLTELMGGRLWVESQEGLGSTFHVTIPYRPAPAQKLPPLPGKNWQGKRVLAVDDNATNRLILEAYLSKWGLSPKIVSSAQEALAELRLTPYDLFLLDWLMPEMDGAELACAVKAEFGSAAPPMVMLSSSANSAKEVFRDRDNPFAALLTKPIRRQHLYRTIARFFSGVVEPETSPSKSLELNLAQSAPLRILLADDNPINQKVGTRLLERWGYRPDLASNGLEVLQALHRQPYDLVLLDVQMPEMDGLEAARRIRAEWDDQKRPMLVALTAGAMKEDRQRCLAAGMDYYLSKPLNVLELQTALENCYAARLGRNVAVLPELILT